MISAGVSCLLVGGCSWKLRIGKVKNWQRRILFRRSLAQGTMLPDSFASTVNACGGCCLANGDLLIHTGEMLAKIYTTVSRSRLQLR